jgi:hypothetical protein
MLQTFAVAVMVFPSDAVIKPIGAVGYLAGLIGMFLAAAWAVAALLGVHDPKQRRHPIRWVLCSVWLSALTSYALIDRATLDTLQLQAADRFLMQLLVVTGAAFVAAECLDSIHDIRRVLRALTWGGALCGAVAGLQFWASVDVSKYFRMLPGFTVNHANSFIYDRSALNRVTGTAIHPIELGVTAAMLLPLAIYLAVYVKDHPFWKRWMPVALIAVSIPASVSRSAIVAVALSVGVLVALMPVRQRLVAFSVLPLPLAAVFMTAHGLIGALTKYFSAGTSDQSVANRVDNYPMVERLVRELPWFGHGGGTYIANSAVHILDNQYLLSSIELGLVGVLALLIFGVAPIIVALRARAASTNPELRFICAALAGAALAAAVCSAFFDSWSFPMFFDVDALVLGLIGATWRLAALERRQEPAHRVRSIPGVPPGPTRFAEGG